MNEPNVAKAVPVVAEPAPAGRTETESTSAKATADKWRAEPMGEGYGDRWMVIDQADKIISMGVYEWQARLIAAAPKAIDLAETMLSDASDRQCILEAQAFLKLAGRAPQ